MALKVQGHKSCMFLEKNPQLQLTLPVYHPILLAMSCRSASHLAPAMSNMHTRVLHTIIMPKNKNACQEKLT